MQILVEEVQVYFRPSSSHEEVAEQQEYSPSFSPRSWRLFSWAGAAEEDP